MQSKMEGWVSILKPMAGGSNLFSVELEHRNLTYSHFGRSKVPGKLSRVFQLRDMIKTSCETFSFWKHKKKI